MALSYLPVAFLGLVGLSYVSLLAFISLLESRQMWTYRLRVSVHEHYWRMGICSSFSVALGLTLATSLNLHGSLSGICVLAIYTICTSMVLTVYTQSALEKHAYCVKRWAAWTGPSRTGIQPALVKKLLKPSPDLQETQPRPTIRRAYPWDLWGFSGFWTSSTGIPDDPTDLIRTGLSPELRLRLSQTNFIYHPIPDKNDGPISILWGERLGFQRRCSRAIIAVPRRYLTSNPTTPQGLQAHAICLAYGILGRNKGLNPEALICNPNQRVFEENSIWWPRPAKTMRGFYKAELAQAFGVLGDAYVAAATELALLLADADDAVVLDWLDGCMEQQDLELNWQARVLGATDEELLRLYRGHYAAMLVSLSVHRVGVRVRPEMLVFDAVCAKDGVAVPKWALGDEMEERRGSERLIAGPGIVETLVKAIV